MQIALLVALAKVLSELQTPDESTLQQCLHVTQRVAASYRGLWPKQRIPVHAALNILLAGLRSKPALLQSLLPRLVGMLLTYTLKPADSNVIAGEFTISRAGTVLRVFKYCMSWHCSVATVEGVQCAVGVLCKICQWALLCYTYHALMMLFATFADDSNCILRCSMYARLGVSIHTQIGHVHAIC